MTSPSPEEVGAAISEILETLEAVKGEKFCRALGHLSILRAIGWLIDDNEEATVIGSLLSEAFQNFCRGIGYLPTKAEFDEMLAILNQFTSRAQQTLGGSHDPDETDD